MSKDNFAVSIVSYACPICGDIAQTNIIMNNKLTKKAAQEVREADGKIVGYSDTACEKCASHKDEVVYIVEINASLSKPNNPYRTGYIWGVRPDFPLVAENSNYVLTTKDGVRYMFVDKEVTTELGFHKFDCKES